MNNDELKQVKCSAHKQDAIFMDEFEKETDRAAGIVGAAILDSALESALKSYLVKSTHAKNDSLFDGPNAPLSSFSSKIDMMLRLGLISEDIAKSLHIVRRIRNNFAHDIVNCDFKNQRIVSLINELTILIFKNYKKYNETRANFPKGARGDFQMALSRIVWWFSCGAFLKIIKQRKSKKREF